MENNFDHLYSTFFCRVFFFTRIYKCGYIYSDDSSCITYEILSNRNELLNLRLSVIFSTRDVFTTLSSIYDSVFFTEIVNGDKLVTIFVKKLHHRCFIGS